MFGDSLTIAVLAGTTRENRQSIRAARYVAEFGTTLPNVQIIFVDPKDFSFPGDGNKDVNSRDPRYSDITARADAFFIVSPEYNHSFPSSLKRMLDSEYDNYSRKPVAIAGASDGNWGGVRAVEALILTTHTMGMVATAKNTYFPYVDKSFDERNQPLPDKKEAIDANLKTLYDELIWFARILKYGRHHLK
ncbi:MAG TPA: NADPH-dependent FMN reductase [Candidatus Saccharimonadales bacterium]|nr:NADPH-dependent FMN reductase [Candidatus Saccharimonadales bacterium]